MQVIIAIETDGNHAQFVTLGVASLRDLIAAPILPGRRRQHRQLDTQAGDRFGFTLIGAHHQRFTDHDNSHAGYYTWGMPFFQVQ